VSSYLHTRNAILLSAVALAATVADAQQGCGFAQGKLDARYTVTLGGLQVGRGAWVIDIADDHFTSSASGATSGLMRVFASGQGQSVSRGTISGGQLIVAPNFDADVMRASKAAGLVALPGVMTPSEGFAALKAGADGLKLFPAEIIPPAVFKAWRAVFPPDCLLLAVGGVGVANLKTYADAGASGYGIGSALYKPGRSPAEIAPLARALVAAANA